MKNLKFIFLLISLLPYILISFSGKGSGTDADPYQITTMAELQEVDDERTASYIIMNDLDATGFKFKWISLHDGGALNGNGHVIKHLNSCGLIASCFNCKVYKIGIEYDTVNCTRQSGIIGNNEGSNGFSECYTTGVLVNASSGFCGINYGSIINCYSSCTLTTTTGELKSRGFINWGGSLHCYFSGYLAGEGKHDFFYDDNNYWNKDFYPRPDTFTSKGIGKTTAEMMKKSTYRYWDFDSVWCIDEGKDYPRLRAFNKCAPVSVQESDADNRQQPVVQSVEISPNPATDDLKITVGTRRAVSLHIS
ncbi:MAG: hypothetical protein NT007_08450, partial [Candidatus Kapabacteria bacterium]|nr:hypothetical protein [Candidatus Kapabacteria bacterium]